MLPFQVDLGMMCSHIHYIQTRSERPEEECMGGMPAKGLSALDPDSIHIDFIPRSTSYGSGSIHFVRVHTTNLTRDDSYTRRNYGHVIDHAFVNKSEYLRRCFGCFFFCGYVFTKENDEIVWRRNAR